MRFILVLMLLKQLIAVLIFRKFANKKKPKTFQIHQKVLSNFNLRKQHAATSTQTIILMEATSIYHELWLNIYLMRAIKSVTNPARARYFVEYV